MSYKKGYLTIQSAFLYVTIYNFFFSCSSWGENEGNILAWWEIKFLEVMIVFQLSNYKKIEKYLFFQRLKSSVNSMIHTACYVWNSLSQWFNRHQPLVVEKKNPSREHQCRTTELFASSSHQYLPTCSIYTISGMIIVHFVTSITSVW